MSYAILIEDCKRITKKLEGLSNNELDEILNNDVKIEEILSNDEQVCLQNINCTFLNFKISELSQGNSE